MVEKILWFPSNRPTSCATPLRPPRNPTALFFIPITAIACRGKMSEKKPPPFSKNPPDRRAVLPGLVPKDSSQQTGQAASRENDPLISNEPRVHSRDDGEAFHFAAVWFAPYVPQSRHGERLLLRFLDEPTSAPCVCLLFATRRNRPQG